MRAATDITGRRFGKLVALEVVRTEKRNARIHTYWRCRCECGGETVRLKESLTKGLTKSCGCTRGSPINIKGQRFGKLVALCIDGRYSCGPRWRLQCDCGETVFSTAGALRAGQGRQCKRCWAASTGKHRLYKSRLYRVWASMKVRCQNPKHVAWHRYGGRGIAVCPEWQEFEPFASWALSHGYRDDLQIDRSDNNGGYSPENCRFVTPKENMANRECSKCKD